MCYLHSFTRNYKAICKSYAVPLGNVGARITCGCPQLWLSSSFASKCRSTGHGIKEALISGFANTLTFKIL